MENSGLVLFFAMVSLTLTIYCFALRRKASLLSRSLQDERAVRSDVELKLSEVSARYVELAKRYEVHIGLEYREERKTGFFWDKHEIEVFQTYYFGGLAVGAPRLVSSKRFSQVNDQNVKLVIEEIMAPLLQAGLKVAVAAAAAA